MNFNIGFGVALVLFVGLGSAHADVGREQALQEAVRQFATKLEDQNKQCIEGSGTATSTTNDIEICFSTMADSAAEAVDQKYQSILKAHQEDTLASKKSPEMLKKSQALWQEYVQAECDAIYEEYIDGSARGTFAAECKHKLAMQRLSALDQW